MAQIVNFNKARKALTKGKKQAQAAENTVKFGRTKAQKTLEQARADKAKRDLDNAERED